jgi:hypothetical protein
MAFASPSKQEVPQMMPIDMTAQIAPVFWGMVTLLFIAALGIGVSGLRNREGVYRAICPEREHSVSDHGLSEAA